jgi:hypothetical protein
MRTGVPLGLCTFCASPLLTCWYSSDHMTSGHTLILHTLEMNERYLKNRNGLVRDTPFGLSMTLIFPLLPQIKTLLKEIFLYKVWFL